MVLLIFPLTASADISPSQVLVLYNADWVEDHPLTEKGQDSKEIAEHYVKMNTNPETGEKPYILGLSSNGGGFLNQSHLEEKSHDNKSGIVLTHLPEMIGSTHGLRDGRLVEFTLPKTQSEWDLDTLTMRIGPKNAKLSEQLVLIGSGQNLFPGRIKLQESGEFNVRLNGTGFITGTFTVSASCRNKAGSTETWQADYHDINDAAISRTGPDGARDDANYMEFIEAPIKTFLENPANALNDNLLLKDHILYFVISYGLPRTCIATYGIEKGITTAPNNFGAVIDLGQRLQMIYYDFDRVLGTTPQPYRFETKNAFSAYFFRAPMAFPLFGHKANPFVHPDVYKNPRENKNLSKALSFSTENRRKNNTRHLYFTMRIDGTDPVQAKALIDRSVYARKYATQGMGIAKGRTISRDESTTGQLKYNPAGRLFRKNGFKRIFYKNAARYRLELFRLPPDYPFYNEAPVYLPGGIAATVMSESGWNAKNSPLYKYLDAGVSITASAAHVYRGAPHIHNKSWWDDTVFYPAILNGRTAGEALLMNQAHLEWITCFIGDPLLRIPGDAAEKTRKWNPEKIDITLIPLQAGSGSDKTVLMAHLKSSNNTPRVAQMKAYPSNAPDSTPHLCEIFHATPYVTLDNDELEKYNNWTLHFIDPFGVEIVTALKIIIKDGKQPYVEQ